MTVKGKVKGGVVVPEDPGKLAEGLEVEIFVPNSKALLDENGQSLGQKLLKHAGKAVGLPPDAARNLDQHLYGTRRR